MRHDPLGFLSTELDSLKQQGLYRRLRILEDEQKPKTTFDHRQVVNLSSNNYLGLTTHPRLREAPDPRSVLHIDVGDGLQPVARPRIEGRPLLRCENA